MTSNDLSRDYSHLDLAHLDNHIQKVDERTRSFKHRLEKYSFFVIGKQRVITSSLPSRPEHYIITSDTDTAFVGEDRLVGGHSTPIRCRIILTSEMSINAQNLMFLAHKSLKSITNQMESLKLKFGDAFCGCAQFDRDTGDELGILCDWLKRIERRIEILQEDADRITAMEKDGWEIGVTLTTTEGWDFVMRAHQWRYDG
ncbi:uncharacterized protein H6S33_013148 [Morchella sextelata]|uniref:uncharacterized protein n=1 Tax=Morchella sextelata TaxID=1174677 RepID=UPI001D05B896|nr:uncharacterized protein H6S33_013148 [Morchella sextelata]KAH0609662.1 hypothetical protein H6S33_013148 [Morchella sextelata]